MQAKIVLRQLYTRPHFVRQCVGSVQGEEFDSRAESPVRLNGGTGAARVLAARARVTRAVAIRLGRVWNTC